MTSIAADREEKTHDATYENVRRPRALVSRCTVTGRSLAGDYRGDWMDSFLREPKADPYGMKNRKR
jgi:hypothetical protein